MSERNPNVNKQCTSSTKLNSSQPFRIKNVLGNDTKEKPFSPPVRTSPKQKVMRKQSQNMESCVVSNSTLNDIATRCQNINMNIDSTGSQGTEKIKKKKNARRKEKLKKMHLQIPQVNTANMFQPVQTFNNVPNLPVNVMNTHGSVNSSYLENVAYHPNFQFIQFPHGNRFQNMSFEQNLPLPQMSPKAQNSPQAQNSSLPTSSPQHFQNLMQHPLLYFQNNTSQNVAQHNIPTASLNKTLNPENKKKNEKSKESTHFELYMSEDEVAEGLKNNVLLEGVLRINPKQYQHSYVSSRDRSQQDVLIDGIRDRNRAMEGDVVVVQILVSTIPPEEKTQQRAKVVFVKDKIHSRTCIGTLKLMPDKNRRVAFFVPRDYRVPRLNIPCTSWPDDFYNNSKSYENTLFLAKIIQWADTRYAMGTLEGLIGTSGDIITEAKAILAQNCLDITPFGPETRDLYPRLDYTIPLKEIELREDCRNLCIFSIDPYNCRDIDDAVSCRELENGNYEIGVHISDVGHFLTENTKLDAKVAEKATTIYMVERAYHMLPEDLCILCSLFPGVDKLAFSVFWEISKDAKVLSHRFAKTVIHSCCQLAYEHAQNVLEDSENMQDNFPEIYNGFTFDDIKKTIKILGGISAIFRTNRFDGGALRIDQPTVNFCLDSSGLPKSLVVYESQQSHQLIEEFMLLTNITVANRIYEDHPQLAFLRCHPPPSNFMLRELANTLKPMNIDLDIASAGTLHKSLLLYSNPENFDRGKNMVLSMLCAKPMARAKYFCAGNYQEDSDFEHFALNIPLYTHFTSPIRRYADIMVHRLLAASLSYTAKPDWQVDNLNMIAAQCNKQKYNAKKAGEMSKELYTMKYIERHSPVVTEAVVFDVRERHIDVIVASMGLNRRIYLNKDFPGKLKIIKNDASFRLSKMKIIWPEKDGLPEVTQILEVFSIVNIEMRKADEMVNVETKLCRPQ